MYTGIYNININIPTDGTPSQVHTGTITAVRDSQNAASGPLDEERRQFFWIIHAIPVPLVPFIIITFAVHIIMPSIKYKCGVCDRYIQQKHDGRTVTAHAKWRLQPYACVDMTANVSRVHRYCYDHPDICSTNKVRHTFATCMLLINGTTNTHCMLLRQKRGPHTHVQSKSQHTPMRGTLYKR